MHKIQTQHVQMFGEKPHIVRSPEPIIIGGHTDDHKGSFAAHKGLSENYEVSCAKLDYLVVYVKQFSRCNGYPNEGKAAVQ